MSSKPGFQPCFCQIKILSTRRQRILKKKLINGSGTLWYIFDVLASSFPCGVFRLQPYSGRSAKLALSDMHYNFYLHLFHQISLEYLSEVDPVNIL